MDLQRLLDSKKNDIIADPRSPIARKYVSLATKAKIPSLDLQSLFTCAS